MGRPALEGGGRVALAGFRHSPAGLLDGQPFGNPIARILPPTLSPAGHPDDGIWSARVCLRGLLNPEQGSLEVVMP